MFDTKSMTFKQAVSRPGIVYVLVKQSVHVPQDGTRAQVADGTTRLPEASRRSKYMNG